MNDTTNTYFCEQCLESVKRGAKICPHCSFEQYPDSDKANRKKWKRGLKKGIACAAFALFITMVVAAFYGFSKQDDPDRWLTLARYTFFSLVCLHFLAFHIIYDEDDKKGAGDDGGGGGGGGE